MGAEWLKFLQEGGGLFGTIVAGLVGLWWFISKALPVINSNMAGITRENTSRTDMIAVLREERDAALAREDAAEARYSELFKDWADVRSQFAAIERDLVRANEMIRELKEHLQIATQTIDALRQDVTQLTMAVRGNHND